MLDHDTHDTPYTHTPVDNEGWDECFYAGYIRPLIDPGDYVGECIECGLRFYPSWAYKIFLNFRVHDFMTDMDVTLFMAMNAPDKRFSNRVSLGSKLYRQWLIANKGIPPSRNDRMTLRVFKDGRFTVNVRTVTKGTGPPYSVVDHLVDRIL